MIWLIRTHLKKLLHATAAIFQKKIPYCVDLWQCTTAVSIPCWSKIYSDNTFCRHLNLCMSIFFCNISKYHLWYPTYEYIALQFLNIMLGFYWFKKNTDTVCCIETFFTITLMVFCQKVEFYKGIFWYHWWYFDTTGGIYFSLFDIGSTNFRFGQCHSTGLVVKTFSNSVL